MKRSIVILFVVLLLTTSLVSALSLDRALLPTGNVEELCEFAEQKFTVGFEIPRFLPYANEIMNIYTTDGKVIGLMVTEDSILTRMECGAEHSKPTYKIYIKDLKTIKMIMSAKSPIDAFNDAKGRGDIRIEGVTFDKQVSNFFTNIALSIGGWFA